MNNIFVFQIQKYSPLAKKIPKITPIITPLTHIPIKFIYFIIITKFPFKTELNVKTFFSKKQKIEQNKVTKTKEKLKFHHIFQHPYYYVFFKNILLFSAFMTYTRTLRKIITYTHIIQCPTNTAT